MAGSNNKSYIAAFKLTVIARAEKIGNRAAGREFNVDERCIRRWRIGKGGLERMPQTKKAQRSGTVAWPDLETELETWINMHRGKALSVLEIRTKAKLIAEEKGLSNFKGTVNWCYRFMRRKQLSVKSKAKQNLENDFKEPKSSLSSSPKVEENCRKDICKKVQMEQKLSFLKSFALVVQEQRLTPTQIVNVSEIPFSFQFVNSGENNAMPVLTANSEKLSFTCILSCAGNGEKLKPFLIFKRKNIPDGNYPYDTVISANDVGNLCPSLIIDWLYKIWCKRKASISDCRNVLLVDFQQRQPFQCAKAEFEKLSTTLIVIPEGFTEGLHPLSLMINKIFEVEMMKCYEKWLNSDLHSFTKGGKMRKALPEEIAKWVSESWNSIEVSTIIRSFQQTGIIKTKSGTDSDSVCKVEKIEESYRNGSEEIDREDANNCNEAYVKIEDDELRTYLISSYSCEDEFDEDVS